MTDMFSELCKAYQNVDTLLDSELAKWTPLSTWPPEGAALRDFVTGHPRMPPRYGQYRGLLLENAERIADRLSQEYASWLGSRLPEPDARSRTLLRSDSLLG